MRSGPVNLLAAGATPKFLIVDFCKRLELLNHISFGDFSHAFITAKASRERSNRFQKVEPTDHFDCLLVGVLGPGIVTGFYHGMHEQAPVTRQQCAILAVHDAQQVAVIRVLIVGNIKAEQAKVTCESSQMAICYKATDRSEL